MGIPEPIRRLTEPEYLAIERIADFKSEFFDGKMIPRSLCSPTHCMIAVNLTCEIGNQLKRRPYLVFGSDLRVKTVANGMIAYPDISVVREPMEFAGSDEDSLTNPTLLVDVMSFANDACDRGKKFENYRQIPSLKEYLLVSQFEPRIEQYVREDAGSWSLREATGLEGQLSLPSLDIVIALAEVFANVKFVATPLREPARRAR